MSFFSFRKRIEHRKFDYIPRFYDPDKEELEERLKLYNREGTNVDLAQQRIRGGFKRNYRTNTEVSRQARHKSNRILLMTLAVLLLLAFVFISKYLPRMVAAFE